MMKLMFVPLAWMLYPLALAPNVVCQTTPPHPAPKGGLAIPAEAARPIDNLKQRTTRETIPALEDEYLSYAAPNIEVGETLVTKIEDRDAEGRIRYTTITTTRLPRPETITGSSVAQSARAPDPSEARVSASPSALPMHVPKRSGGPSRAGRKPVLKSFTLPTLRPVSETDHILEVLPEPDILPVLQVSISIVLPHFISEPSAPPPFVMTTVRQVHQLSFRKRILGWVTGNRTNK